MIVTIVLAVVSVIVVAVAVLVVAAIRSEPSIKIVEWKDRERWIRLSPNPGVRLTENFQWSKAYGKGRR